MKYFQWIVVLLLIGSAFFAFGSDRSITTSVTANGSMYLLEGMKILNAEGVSIFYRGPMYPIFIALSFFIRGFDIVSAHWMNEFVFITCILCLFFFSRQLYGSSAALVASSIPISAIWLLPIRRDFDPAFLLSAWILLAGCFLAKGIQTDQKRNFYFSGLCLGFAFLTKETGIFYLLFPLVGIFLIRPLNKFRANILDLLRVWATAGLAIAPWILFLILKGQHLSMLLGEMRPGANRLSSFFGEKSLPEYVIEALTTGSINSLKLITYEFWLFPLALGGIVFALWHGLVKQNRSDLFLLSLVLPILPIVIMYGLYQDGLRHIVIFLLVSCIAVSRLLELIYGYLNRSSGCLKLIQYFRDRWLAGNDKLLNLRNLFMLSTLLLVFIVQMAVPFYRSGVYNVYIGSNVTVKGRYGEKIKDASVWVNVNVPAGSTIYAGGMYGGAVKFFTREKYSYHWARNEGNMPMYYWIDEIDNGTISRKIPGHVITGKIVALTTSRKFKSPNRRYRRQIMVIFEKDYLDFINRVLRQKNWIMTHDDEKVRFPFIDDMISENSLLRYDDMGVAVRETNPRKAVQIAINGSVHVSPWTIDDLKWLKANYKNEYAHYIQFLNTRGVKLSDRLQ